jgi:hypothetical protein
MRAAGADSVSGANGGSGWLPVPANRVMQAGILGEVVITASAAMACMAT